MSKISRSITKLLPKLSRENKSNMLNSLKLQQDINLKWQRELQQKISDNNKNKVQTNEYMYLIDAWDDARQVNNEIEQDIKEVTKSIIKDDNINKGGKRKIRKTKKSKKNKRKTRRIKGGQITQEQALALRNEIHTLERQAQPHQLQLDNINNGNRAFELMNDRRTMMMGDELEERIKDEKKAIKRVLDPIYQQQGNIIVTLMINGYPDDWIWDQFE